MLIILSSSIHLGLVVEIEIGRCGNSSIALSHQAISLLGELFLHRWDHSHSKRIIVQVVSEAVKKILLYVCHVLNKSRVQIFVRTLALNFLRFCAAIILSRVWMCTGLVDELRLGISGISGHISAAVLRNVTFTHVRHIRAIMESSGTTWIIVLWGSLADGLVVPSCLALLDLSALRTMRMFSGLGCNIWGLIVTTSGSLHAFSWWCSLVALS